MSTNIRKQLTAETRAVGDRRIEFRVSTRGVDRDNDTIAPDGWRLDRYKRNPVVLWAHQYDQPPVAKAVSIRVVGDALVASADFVPGEIVPFAETVFQLLKGGFLSAVSVGFHPVRLMRNAERGGVDYVEQELLEFSVVPVPANPDALVVGRGVDRPALAKWLGGDGARGDESVIELADAPPHGDDEVDIDGLLAPDARAEVEAAVARYRRQRGEPYEPVADVSRAELAEMMRQVLPRLVAEVVGNEIASGIRRARGRVD